MDSPDGPAAADALLSAQLRGEGAIIIALLDGTAVTVHTVFCDFQQVAGKSIEATVAEVEDHARPVERVLGLLTQAAFAALL